MEEEKKITLYEADIYERQEPKEETRQFIIFRISSEWYALEIIKVRGITKIDKITYLPSAPGYISGIVNLRGNILSVTDLKTIFGLAQEELTEKSRLIVIEFGPLETGLLVDEVACVADVAVTRIDPTLTTLPPEKAGYIEGEFKLEDRLVGILKVEKILAKIEPQVAG
ncbi:MAG: chemotaxis protein CheW [Candidatus Omnitrophota bacterium]